MWALDVYNSRGEPLGPLETEPLVIRQYERYPLALHLTTDGRAEAFQLFVEGKPLKRKGSVFFLGGNKEARGRMGEVEIIVYYDGHPVGIRHLAHTEAHISEAQYRFMIRDLKRLLSLASEDLTSIRSREESWEHMMLSVHEERLRSIERYISTLAEQIRCIVQAPRTAIQKRYFLARETEAVRVDGRTIQWSASHGAGRPGYALTYRHEETHDLYENRFIAHIIDWLSSVLTAIPERYRSELRTEQQQLHYRLEELQTALGIRDEDGEGGKERRSFRERQREVFQSRLVTLETYIREHIPYCEARVARCRQTLATLRSQPLLAGIVSQTTLVVKPTLVLLREPAYRMLYDGYLAIRQSIQSEELQQVEDLLDRVPVERTSKLYEYWVFLQVYNELRHMGFTDVPGSGIWSLIDRRTFRLRSNACVRMTGDPELYTSLKGKPLELRLYYERRLGSEGQRCPDIYIEFKRHSTVALILDAKYRNYRDLDGPKYDTDLTEVAFHKYLHLAQQKGNDWVPIADLAEYRDQIKASFIVHSSEGDSQHQLCNYGSEGQENRYGSIPLIPDESGITLANLRLLLSMFMRVHLYIHHVCWSVQHSFPQRAARVKETGGKRRAKWEWQYRCQSCENAWWINHCGHCLKDKDEHILKITFSDPADNFYALDNRHKANGRQLMKCAKCDQSYDQGRRH